MILVEGRSDQAAIETLAGRRGRPLDDEGISVVAMGGAAAVSDHLHRLSEFAGVVAGLCDEGEVGDLRRGLERVGFGASLTRADLARVGFHVCVADLEDELIRAAGVPVVEEVIAGEGDLRSFRTMQGQPAWRGRPVVDQLRRFFGAGAGRKERYARALVEAVDLSRVPEPLGAVLDHVWRLPPISWRDLP